jgi:hypothetical protein
MFNSKPNLVGGLGLIRAVGAGLLVAAWGSTSPLFSQGSAYLLTSEPVAAVGSGASQDGTLSLRSVAGRPGAGFATGQRLSAESYGWTRHSAILLHNAPIRPGLAIAGAQVSDDGHGLRLASVVGRIGAGAGVGGSLGLASFGWSVQTPVQDTSPFHAGLEHRVIGGATVALNEAGNLRFSGLEFAGQDGVAIDAPPGVDGLGVRFAPPPPDGTQLFPVLDSSYRITVRSPEGATLGEVTARMGNPGYVLDCVFGGEPGAPFTVRALGDYRGKPYLYEGKPWVVSGLYWPRGIRAAVRADGALQLDLEPGISQIYNTGQTQVRPPEGPDGPIVYATRVELISRQGLLPPGTPIGSLELRFGSTSPATRIERTIEEEWVERFGRRFEAHGTPGFRGDATGLAVVGLGRATAWPDGVLVDLRHRAADEIDWRGSSSGGLDLEFPFGLRSGGAVGGSLTLAARGPTRFAETGAQFEFGSLTLADGNAGAVATPDFTPLLAGDLRLEVLDAGGDVLIRDGNRMEFQGRDHPENRQLRVGFGAEVPGGEVPPCFAGPSLREGNLAWTLAWQAPVPLRLPDGSRIDARGVRWVALGGVSPVDAFQPISQGIERPDVVPPGRLRTLALTGRELGEVRIVGAHADPKNPTDPFVFSGFQHAPLGNAQLSRGDGVVGLGNLMGTAEDGVGIQLGAVDAVSIRLDSPRVRYGGGLYLALFNDAGQPLGELDGEHLDSIVWRSKGDTELPGYRQSLALLGPGDFQIVGYEEGLPARSFPPISSKSLGGFSLRFPPTVISARIQTDGRLVVGFETGNERRPGENPFAILETGVTFFPTRVELVSAPGRIPPGVKLGRLELRFRYLLPFVVGAVSVSEGVGPTFTGLGSAVIDTKVNGGLLRVEGLEGTAPGGFRMDPSGQGTAISHATLEIAEPEFLPSDTAEWVATVAPLATVLRPAPPDLGSLHLVSGTGGGVGGIRAQFPGAPAPNASLVRISAGTTLAVEIPGYVGFVTTRAITARAARPQLLSQEAGEAGTGRVRLQAEIMANGALMLEHVWDRSVLIALADGREFVGTSVAFVSEGGAPLAPMPLSLELEGRESEPLLLISVGSRPDVVPSHRLIGRATDRSGVGVPGVIWSLEGTENVQGDAEGVGDFGLLPIQGPHVIRPRLSGMNFDPPSATVRLLAADAEIRFTAVPATLPRIQMIQDAEGLLLSWPDLPGFMLELTESLGDRAAWEPVIPAPEGNRYRPGAADSARFFRLRGP